jgi:hypothetical protein
MTRAVAAKGDKCKDVVVKFKLLKQEDTITFGSASYISLMIPPTKIS